jgi:hypothetical protein
MNTLKRKILTLFCVILPLFCLAQNTLPRQYDYDDAGNRILRKVIQMLYAPPAPQDSLQVTSDELQVTSDELQVTSDELQVTSDELQELKLEQYFVETIAQTEIKIYPNPTTEKITLDIARWETLQMGIFKLYSMTGQLLQEHPIYSVTTEVSLAGLARGTYILKVQINEKTEDWKIIKQ